MDGEEGAAAGAWRVFSSKNGLSFEKQVYFVRNMW
jgi:hypothetical protein